MFSNGVPFFLELASVYHTYPGVLASQKCLERRMRHTLHHLPVLPIDTLIVVPEGLAMHPRGVMVDMKSLSLDLLRLADLSCRD